MPSAPNPIERTFTHAPTPVSTRTFTIAGILCTIYGLSELPASPAPISCLWLLNPRLATQASMAPLAHNIIAAWNNTPSANQPHGLIAVAFDQRNHGSRQVSPTANEAWRGGNETHAQDMFSIYHGTALDVSQLIAYLPAYVFPDSERRITEHMVLGVSLGGHAAWHCLLHEPRIRAGVVVIGCPDYVSLMRERARLSRRKTWMESEPAGVDFVGSRDFPEALVEAVGRWDPAGLLMRGTGEGERGKVLGGLLGGKRILNLAGGADRLVPYKNGEGFLRWLKGMVGEGGEAEGYGITVVDKVYEGVGHEMTGEMVEEAIRFLMTARDEGGENGSKL